MQVEKKYVGCRFLPSDVAAAVRTLWAFEEEGVNSFDSFSVELANNETISVDDLDHFLLASNSGYEALVVHTNRGEHSLRVAVQSRSTTVAVKSKDRVRIDGIFEIFEGRRKDVALSEVEQVVPRYSTAHLSKRLESCSLSVKLLKGLELQLLERIPACTGISSKAVAEGWSCLIQDEIAEKLPRAADYDREYFRNAVRAVSLRGDITEGGRSCKVEITFEKRPSVDVAVRCPNPREGATTLVAECIERINEESNANLRWILFAALVQILGTLCLVVSAFYLLTRSFGHSIMVLLVGGALLAMARVIMHTKPLSAFDTVRQRSRDDRFKWLFRGLVGFVLFTMLLNTAFAALRKAWLGW